MNVLAKPSFWLERQDLDLAEVRNSASHRLVRLIGRVISRARPDWRNSLGDLARLALCEFHILTKDPESQSFMGRFRVASRDTNDVNSRGGADLGRETLAPVCHDASTNSESEEGDHYDVG